MPVRTGPFDVLRADHQAGRAGQGWISRPQEERGNPMGHWLQTFSKFVIAISITKNTPGWACLW